MTPVRSFILSFDFRARAVRRWTARPRLVFFRSSVPHTEFSTGGAGNPTPQPPDPATDPLASEGALIISHGNRFLFAVNAGSNQISVLKINKSGLQLVDIVSSGGSRPISLALHDDLLYVL